MYRLWVRLIRLRLRLDQPALRRVKELAQTCFEAKMIPHGRRIDAEENKAVKGVLKETAKPMCRQSICRW